MTLHLSLAKAIKFISFVLMFCLLVACQQDEHANNQSHQSDDPDQAFEAFKETFLEQLWELYPGYAVYVGYYKHDNKMTIPDEASRQKEMAFAESIMTQLNGFDPAKLSLSNATDLELIKNQLESSKWYSEVFKSREWDPSDYNVAGPFGVILNTEYKPLEERLRAIFERIDSVPAYYQAATKNIKNPTLEHTELAIQQNSGAIGLFATSLRETVSASKLTDKEKAMFQPKIEAAVEAIQAYIEWLEEKKQVLSDGGARDFRIGAELYEQKFKYDIVSNFSAKALYEHAIAAKSRLHEEMILVTEQLWPKYLSETPIPENKLVAVKQMIDHLSVKHVKREDFVDEIRRQIPELEKFVSEKDLLDQDPTRPLVVREAPEYQRGIAGASINAPGPYDATANTYYNVTPLDNNTEEQAESWLREYNHWILQILNIHEAVPGHYTQLMHANKSPSKIKSIFGNGAMIEGWAVYAEKMMIEAGYGNGEPEMLLMYNKWHLRAVVNTILDYSIQVLGMTKDQAMSMMINEAFQEQAEAEGKWRRATLTQVQLTSYYNGFAEIYAFREELKQKMGDKFDLKTFHNRFLSFGNAPVSVIRSLMLKELEK
ncbi:DUF885 domain-containing protein [Aliikangiella marina]|uniref:DUF885 domain-containing protein n=1 Tax=Aliikangiella marina TaxID=1712262 RepID=A0A545T709_9GAMM|nr:DUF885 domain-containing protein [Aliikangiella marina]TQV73009.1 DUF885 domain-containing protein [Aliikangiella marina]